MDPTYYGDFHFHGFHVLGFLLTLFAGYFIGKRVAWRRMRWMQAMGDGQAAPCCGRGWRHHREAGRMAAAGEQPVATATDSAATSAGATTSTTDPSRPAAGPTTAA